MKLVTYNSRENGEERIGALRDDLTTIVDLSPLAPSMLGFIDGGDETLQAARSLVADQNARTLSLNDVHLRAPIPIPRQVRDCMVFEKHVQQAFGRAAQMKYGLLARPLAALGLIKVPPVWYEQPIYYKSNRFSVIGTEQDVVWPSYSHLMDFECELGIIIGQQGRDIPREKAREYIFGYLIFNDMSARDAQFKEMAGRLGPAKGKDFDTGNVIGPWLTTADEIPDPYCLPMTARVNGEVWGRGNSADMHHRFEDIIVHISRGETLYPGELIGSGTVGDGCGLEHGRFLSPGDLIELEIEGLGTLRNRIVR